MEASGRREFLGFGSGGGTSDVSTRGFGREGDKDVSVRAGCGRGLGSGLSLRLGLGGATRMELSSITMQNRVREPCTECLLVPSFRY